MSTIQGTIVAAKVTTGDTVSTYPVADQDEIKGGHHSVADITARDAIPAERREEGMTVAVIADQIVYKLSGGITNSDWVCYNVTSDKVNKILVSTADVPTFDAAVHEGALYFKYVVGA
jgi:hypothetical protein